MSRFDQLKEAAKAAAKQTADVAGKAASAATDKAGEATAAGIEKAAVIARDPATHARAKVAAVGAARGAGRAAEGAGRAVKSALDKVNPDLLAGIVIKATSIQEQANAVLRANRSLYRIGGIEIGASFPPSISFQIIRAAELELEEQALGILPEPGIASAELEAVGIADALEDDGAAVVDAKAVADEVDGPEPSEG
jgi:hypothetical protein